MNCLLNIQISYQLNKYELPYVIIKIDFHFKKGLFHLFYNTL